MVSWCLLTFIAATYSMVVNDRVITGANGVLGGLDAGSQVQVACRYQSGIADSDVYKIEASDGSEYLLNSNVQTKFTSSYTQRMYTLTNADKQGTATYRCIDKNKAGCPDYSQVTISFSTGTPSPGPSFSNYCPPGGSNGPPYHPTAASKSLNPQIIYTISAVFLLGTLAIVAIITCWIRVRRSYNRRMLESSANPRDHNSNTESTPLMSSELTREGSPTFHEGGEIQGQMRPEVGDDDMETSNSSSSRASSN